MVNYGCIWSVKRKNKKEFCGELTNLANVCAPNWLIGGGFNVFRQSNETSTRSPTRNSMNKFNAFIQNNNLIDPPLINCKYTLVQS